MKEPKETKYYYRLVAGERSMIAMEKVTVEGNKIVATELSEATFPQISFDKLRRECFLKVMEAQ